MKVTVAALNRVGLDFGKRDFDFWKLASAAQPKLERPGGPTLKRLEEMAAEFGRELEEIEELELQNAWRLGFDRAFMDDRSRGVLVS